MAIVTHEWGQGKRDIGAGLKVFAPLKVGADVPIIQTEGRKRNYKGAGQKSGSVVDWW